GEKPADPEEIARRHRLARQSKRKRDGIAGRKRQQAISAAAAIWREGQEATASPVHRYLARRGIGEALLPVLPTCLRFHPDLPYMERGGSGWVEIHRGPAMLGKMVQPDGRFGGVHRTWLDCDQPKGKIRIPRQGEFAAKRQGECFDPKKTLGSKKGGTIRLDLPEGADTMVVGEGIETTLTAMVSAVFPGAAFVC
ncbi:MAG: hypothetical protein GY717_20380, partial [Rhodobacteraceae bacterium]|nr:hypothetical protein [Paracoccaceae bacterium]